VQHKRHKQRRDTGEQDTISRHLERINEEVLAAAAARPDA
jgi:hypothetical protein